MEQGCESCLLHATFLAFCRAYRDGIAETCRAGGEEESGVNISMSPLTDVAGFENNELECRFLRDAGLDDGVKGV